MTQLGVGRPSGVLNFVALERWCSRVLSSGPGFLFRRRGACDDELGRSCGERWQMLIFLLARPC